MEQISNIASHQVNFKAQTQTQTSPMEAVKNKIDSMEDNEKITVGLSALGVMALAALAIAKRPHKASEAAQTVVETVAQNAEIKKPIYNLVTEAPKMTSTKAFQLADASCGKKAAESAAVFLNNDPQALAQNALDNGMGISQVKKYATRNHTHDAKKLIKQQMADIQQTRVVQDIAARKDVGISTVNAAKLADGAKNVRQGMQNATSTEVVDSVVDASKTIAAAAKEEAVIARSVANDLGTKKANRSAVIAERKAQRAEIEADTTAYKGFLKKAEIEQTQAQKAKNVAEYKESPNYEVGIQKQKQNAAKTSANKARREQAALQKKVDAQAQEYMKKRFTGERLMKIMENPKSSEVDRRAAQKALDEMTK